MDAMNVHENENDGLGLPLGLERDHETMSSSTNSDEEKAKPCSKHSRNQRDRVPLKTLTSSSEGCDRWQALAPSPKSTPFTHDSRQRHQKKWTGGAQQNQSQQGPARARDEIRDGIGVLVLNSSVLTYEDFDYRVRQHLHALHGSRGQQGLRDAFEAIAAATVDKKREDIACWPAYICTLLRVQISDAKQQNAQSKPQRTRKFKNHAVIAQMGIVFKAALLVTLAYVLVHSILQAAAYLGFSRVEPVVGFLVCGYFLEDKFRSVYQCTFGSKASIFRAAWSVEMPG